MPRGWLACYWCGAWLVPLSEEREIGSVWCPACMRSFKVQGKDSKAEQDVPPAS